MIITLLLNVFAEAYLITGEQNTGPLLKRSGSWKEVRHPDGGFLVRDTDSEGVEGQYYSKAEIESFR